MSQIVYSNQKRGFDKSRIYKNPEFFDGVLAPGATSVVIVGEWDVVKEAYEKAGIPVTEVAEGGKLPDIKQALDGPQVSAQTTTDHPDSIVEGDGSISPLIGRDNFEIPANLVDLGIPELRALVRKIDPQQDFKKKAEMISFIETEGPKMLNHGPGRGNEPE